MQDVPKETKRAQAPAKKPGLWDSIQSWDSRLSVTKGLTIVTLLTGFFGGYFQYLNSYEEKVGEQAKADMAAATSTFIEISNAFAEVQMLQESILADYAEARTAKADSAVVQVDAKAASDLASDYSKARTALRQNGLVFARKAEIYIDWPSDLSRDPAAPRALDQDPLTDTLLTEYNFDCDAEANLPHFKGAIFDGSDHGPPNEELCTDPTANGPKTYVDLCARLPGSGAVDPLRKVVNINWWSAKHHVLIMHHCFEALRGRPGAAIDMNQSGKPALSKQQEDYKERLNTQARRIDAYMTLTMAQLERIRVKYRPSGFLCHVPLARDVIGLFSDQCTPIRTAVSERS
ncbi:hypothetical protein [Bradyrhizobium sp. UFLA05-112]